MPRQPGPSSAGASRLSTVAVTTALGSLDFPTTRAEAIRLVGDWPVPYARDGHVPLGDLLLAVPPEAFRDPVAAHGALDRQWGRLAKSLAAIDAAERAARPGSTAKAPRAPRRAKS